MQIEQPNEVSLPPGEAIVTERNRYFTGKYMTARDFQGEQAYFLSRHRLHNRLLHGWGILCGLQIADHPDPECQKQDWIKIRAGVAIDSYGRELILKEDHPFKIPPLSELKPCDAPSTNDASTTDEERPAHAYLIGLRYIEREIEPVPALYSESGAEVGRQEANRVREEVCIEIQCRYTLADDCWFSPGGGATVQCRDDCDEESPGPVGPCLEPDQACGGLVPLALVTYSESGDSFQIETDGRREIRDAAGLLTRIVQVNWEHGGEMSPDELWDPDHEEYRLTVRFDRELLSPEEGTGHGINEHTFVVQYAGAQRDREFLGGEVKIDEEDPYLAVFTIDARHLRPGRENIENYMVYITLKCDFIRDCHGHPVDGNHLRGLLPSGNGTPGGIFESWFFVRPDSED